MRSLRRYAGPIEADFQASYGIDLWADRLADRLTLRRIGLLVEHLPSDGAWQQAVHGPAAEWRLEHELLAGVLQSLRAGNWQRGGGKGARPKPITKPRSRWWDEVILDRLKDVRRRAEERNRRRNAERGS